MNKNDSVEAEGLFQEIMEEKGLIGDALWLCSNKPYYYDMIETLINNEYKIEKNRNEMKIYVNKGYIKLTYTEESGYFIDGYYGKFIYSL